jgi:hypothetical protein
MLKEPSGQELPVDGNRAISMDLPSKKAGTWKKVVDAKQTVDMAGDVIEWVENDGKEGVEEMGLASVSGRQGEQEKCKVCRKKAIGQDFGLV